MNVKCVRAALERYPATARSRPLGNIVANVRPRKHQPPGDDANASTIANVLVRRHERVDQVELAPGNRKADTRTLIVGDEAGGERDDHAMRPRDVQARLQINLVFLRRVVV